MASEKILFISEGKSLILHALQRNLTKNGYELVHCPLDVEALHGEEQAADSPRKSGGHQICRGIHPRADHFSGVRAPCEHGSTARASRVSDGCQRDAGPPEERLIVDDDETFLKTVKNWLSRQYRVTIVTSGAQAMMYVADNQPDLILLDYEMPVTSGPQVLEMLRSEPKTAKIPVIFRGC